MKHPQPIGSGLLDLLAKRMGCIFLSDLRKEEKCHLIHCLLLHFDLYAYPLQEWNEAINYLMNEQVIFTDYDQVLHYLKIHRFAE